MYYTTASTGIARGADPDSPVTPEDLPPIPFTGTIYEAATDVSGEMIHDAEAEMRVILAHQ